MFTILQVAILQKLAKSMMDQMPIARATRGGSRNGTSSTDCPGGVNRAPKLSSEFVTTLPPSDDPMHEQMCFLVSTGYRAH